MNCAPKRVSLRRRANVHNIKFRNSSPWPIYIINSVDKTKFKIICLCLLITHQTQGAQAEEQLPGDKSQEYQYVSAEAFPALRILGYYTPPC